MNTILAFFLFSFASPLFYYISFFRPPLKIIYDSFPLLFLRFQPSTLIHYYPVILNCKSTLSHHYLHLLHHYLHRIPPSTPTPLVRYLVLISHITLNPREKRVCFCFVFFYRFKSNVLAGTFIHMHISRLLL